MEREHQSLRQEHQILQEEHETLRAAKNPWIKNQELEAEIADSDNRNGELRQRIRQVEFDNRALTKQVEGYKNFKQILKTQMEETFRVNRNNDAIRIFEQERVFLSGQINMLTGVE